MKSTTRRCFLRHAGSVALSLACAPAFAQGTAITPGNGLLARLKSAGKVRVGVAVDYPFSTLGPDGTLNGVAPTITKAIMTRLGVPEVEGYVATYGELIPGMMAGRWDITSAALTISKARCEQVRFADPIVFGGDVIVALDDYSGAMPKRLSELARGGDDIAVLAGGVDLKAALAAGIPPERLRQFGNESLEIDALLARRVRFAIMSLNPVNTLSKQRNLKLKTTYPVEDAPARGASCAFRMQDTDLHAAYNAQLRAMKASGELATILKRFDFDTPPELRDVTVEQLCAAAT
ncbi:transporter substrate-binding domain-containing protein [Paraburkholderia sp. SARCC-3016]|uniref:transporter substrate-binding domain-containing protein n=1 Tax=Paraburkholderia sp. SARCC-3016 TaxID=3058611 RepID=UPI00280A0804|nr:transporter substrate-binding domain-containing protein [Paraburkholderia sp. SARCC-3016]MDQ7982302.1 transporter substrate-binding domain-containing protein [Paraburkholderia sp. SARCC-3016]